MSKRTKIKWDEISVKIVPANSVYPNQLNPYAAISGEDRRQVIIELCGKIWARHVNETVAKAALHG